MICDLTGMDVSNACVYDGAEAAAEGVAMCQERKRKKAFVSAAILPDALATIHTYCHGNGMEIVEIPEKDGVTDLDYLKENIDEQTACVYIQHPNYYGNLEDAQAIGEIAHGVGAKYIMGVNPISLGIIKTPAEYGADVAGGWTATGTSTWIWRTILRIYGSHRRHDEKASGKNCRSDRRS